MATKTVQTRIRLKNNTTAGWSSKNPVLLKGEFGFDTSLKYVKVGDGATAWNDLPTVRLPASAIDGGSSSNTRYDIRIDVPGSKFTLLSSADGASWGDVRPFTCKDFGPEISAALAEAKTFAGEVADEKSAAALGQAKGYADRLDEAMGYRVDALDDQVSAIQADYLTSADKDELRGEINGKLGELGGLPDILRQSRHREPDIGRGRPRV